ncbi:MAG: hypothetical protein ACLS4Z_00415 [Christensenellaceae bacterium]
MEEILSVKHLEKHYAGFDLDEALPCGGAELRDLSAATARKDHRLEMHAFPCASWTEA